MPPVAEMIRIAHEGGVGRLHQVAIREHREPFYPKVGDWNRFTANTGGTLVEKCCHYFNLMDFILQEKPTRVFASGGQRVNHLDEKYDGKTPDILDSAYVIVEYPSGARASLDLCMFAEGSEHQEEISVVGDTGKVEAFLPSAELRVGQRRDWRAGVRTEVVHDDRIAHEGFHHGSSFLEHVDFLAAIRNGSRPAIGVAAGLASVAVGVAAHRSIDEHRVVALAEVLEEEHA